VRRLRTVNVALPSESGLHDGLSYTLWLPEPRPAADTHKSAAGGVVILHGAGSSKENHHDFARLCLGSGLAAVCFDQRGHGGSQGSLDRRAAQDVAAMAALLRDRLRNPQAPIALRGSSMGGYMAVTAAALVGAAAVVAICPAPDKLLRAGLQQDSYDFRADKTGLEAFLLEHDLETAIAGLEMPVLLLHAEGDERVPVESSRALSAHLRSPESRLIVVPGGHHRSIQHDRELQAVSLRFIERALAG
jgi:alpha-beta hydrolase superfamily lysophospholipase